MDLVEHWKPGGGRQQAAVAGRSGGGVEEELHCHSVSSTRPASTTPAKAPAAVEAAALVLPPVKYSQLWYS